MSETAVGHSKGRQTLPIAIRGADQGDVSFIFSSWLKSFRLGAMCKHVENTIYFSEHHKVIEKILKRGHCIVACDPNDPASIYGYAAYEIVQGVFVMHYGYVKHPFRALGVMRQLCDHMPHDWNMTGLASHQNHLSFRLAPKYNLVYHPYILVNYDNAPQQDGESKA